MFSILDGCDADSTMSDTNGTGKDALARARRLSDKALLACVKLLARREREATVTLVAHLAILDERRLFLGEGYLPCSSTVCRLCTYPSTPPIIASRSPALSGSFR
jgi:hypothetical protein